MSKTATHHAIHWFEILVSDLDRSQAFYEQLLNVKLRRESLGGPEMAIFPADETAGIKGCLMQGPPGRPDQGTLVYLNAGPSLNATLARLEAAGGRLLTPRVDLPNGIGCFAHIADPDGQRIGLHALD